MIDRCGLNATSISLGICRPGPARHHINFSTSSLAGKAESHIVVCTARPERGQIWPCRSVPMATPWSSRAWLGKRGTPRRASKTDSFVRPLIENTCRSFRRSTKCNRLAPTGVGRLLRGPALLAFREMPLSWEWLPIGVSLGSCSKFLNCCERVGAANVASRINSHSWATLKFTDGKGRNCLFCGL